MKLEAQLAELASLGLALDEGITLEDLLFSFDREDYEAKPFDLVLFVLGTEVEREPFGRPFSRCAWNFDTECIAADGDYAAIVTHLARLARAEGRLTEVRDRVDIEGGSGFVEYVLDGRRQRWDVEVNDDWADPMVVSYVMSALERDGFRFYAKDNGQAAILFYLDDKTAGLSGNSLTLATGTADT